MGRSTLLSYGPATPRCHALATPSFGCWSALRIQEIGLIAWPFFGLCLVCTTL